MSLDMVDEVMSTQLDDSKSASPISISSLLQDGKEFKGSSEDVMKVSKILKQIWDFFKTKCFVQLRAFKSL